MAVHDVATRESVANEIKAQCPLRTVLRPSKACPYFGPSKSCTDCTYCWPVISESVLKVAAVRRASYEKEREKAKALKVRLDLLFPIASALARGIEAARQLEEFIAEEKKDGEREDQGEDSSSFGG